jgi:hypothetical protein
MTVAPRATVVRFGMSSHVLPDKILTFIQVLHHCHPFNVCDWIPKLPFRLSGCEFGIEAPFVAFQSYLEARQCVMRFA